ncbi:hypothetical protein WUBG_16695 [Wuchereria bancrofti]|uniref:Uncharacterized protein n=1 Tax=Wuchereria bancrofti TaxID=6293 RepID=J9DS18_WUCBA|nr:hypothetical protein WUBG_16695 [Wuchereria bancrofti]
MDSDNSKVTYEVQEIERAIARASVPLERSFSDQLNRPPILTPARSSPSSSVLSASVEGLSDVEKRAGHSRKKRKRSEDPKPGQDYITFVSPAGVLPCAEKKKKYTEGHSTMDSDNSKVTYEVQEIERAIARASVPLERSFSDQLKLVLIC